MTLSAVDFLIKLLSYSRISSSIGDTVNSKGFRIKKASSRPIEPNDSNELPELNELLFSFSPRPYLSLNDESYPIKNLEVITALFIGTIGGCTTLVLLFLLAILPVSARPKEKYSGHYFLGLKIQSKNEKLKMSMT